MNSTLTGQTAIVTGASAGIGRAIAKRLAADAVNLILVARREQLLRELAEEVEALGIVATPQPCDLADADDLERLKTYLATCEPNADILVNCAGIEHVEPFILTDPTTWEDQVRLNLLVPLHLSQVFASVCGASGSRLRHQHCLGGSPGGRAGRRGLLRNQGGAGLVGTRGGREWARSGVRVVSIAPGYIHTALADGGLGKTSEPGSRCRGGCASPGVRHT